MDLRPVVLGLGPSGEATARRVAAALGCPLHGREGRVAVPVAFAFGDAAAHARDLFAAGHAVVGICAAGILVRAVAPMLASKREEPPVIAVSDDGGVVVPLLGGHRGANRLAREIAAATGGVAAVTTAGDVSLGAALDDPPPGYRLANPDDAKAATAALLAGGGARAVGERLFPDLPPGDAVEIRVTDGPGATGPSHLLYHPQRHVLGVGCARGAAAAELWENASALLAEAGVAPGAVAAVATLDLKLDEPAVVALARRLGRPLRAFAAAELAGVAVPNPSEVVRAEVGTPSVAEAAALLATGGRLVAAKRKTAATTAALARAEAPIPALPGRGRGQLFVVSLGPGQAAWRTPEASRMVAEAEELVGYGLYIDLLGPLAAGKPRADFPLGGEEARCRHALERAGEGRVVALVCSGDAGVYAMGALVHELLAGDTLSPAAQRVEVVCTPGVSAMQAAAARAGAPLGHDFCAVSLSDLLTPREDILRRLRAAAEGDFVLALYNPVSQRRRTLLEEARAILLPCRPATTPVLLARALGRPEEALRFRRLDALVVDEVDMLTTVIVGSSRTRMVETPDGPRMFTPRGYARKMAGGDLAGEGSGA